MTNNEIDWSKSHCGVMLCTLEQTIQLMPEVEPILAKLQPFHRQDFWADHLIDVKVHMLMPDQFPCIPNWHRDFIPRDEGGKRVRGCKTSPKPMYMWLSGAPLTEYICKQFGKYTKAAGRWHAFTQDDVHRGTAATEHTWRCFIRVIPKEFVHTNTTNVGTQRRHTQVYLDSEKFKW